MNELRNNGTKQIVGSPVRWTKCWIVGRQCLVGVALVVVCQTAFSQAIYRIKPLGYLGGCTAASPVAYGFNATDEVTGQACNVHGDMHAFVWKNDGHPMADLGPNEQGPVLSPCRRFISISRRAMFN